MLEKKETLSLQKIMMLSAYGGAMGATIGVPFYTLKTRMQIKQIGTYRELMNEAPKTTPGHLGRVAAKLGLMREEFVMQVKLAGFKQAWRYAVRTPSAYYGTAFAKWCLPEHYWYGVGFDTVRFGAASFGEAWVSGWTEALFVRAQYGKQYNTDRPVTKLSWLNRMTSVKKIFTGTFFLGLRGWLNWGAVFSSDHILKKTNDGKPVSVPVTAVVAATLTVGLSQATDTLRVNQQYQQESLGVSLNFKQTFFKFIKVRPNPLRRLYAGGWARFWLAVASSFAQVVVKRWVDVEQGEDNEINVPPLPKGEDMLFYNKPYPPRISFSLSSGAEKKKQKPPLSGVNKTTCSLKKAQRKKP